MFSLIRFPADNTINHWASAKQILKLMQPGIQRLRGIPGQLILIRRKPGVDG